MSEEDDLVSDDELDDLSKVPELKKIYDDPQAREELNIDDEMEEIAQRVVKEVDMMNYTEMLLQEFREENTVASVEELSAGKVEVPKRRFPYPKRSILTHLEMERFLKLDKMFKTVHGISQLKRNQYKNYQDYKALQTKVVKEQDEFQQFLMSISSSLVPEYNYVDPEARDFVQKHMLAACAQVKRYKRYYIHVKDFGIMFIPFKNDPLPCPVPKLSKTLGYIKCLNSVPSQLKIPNSMPFKPKQLEDSVNCWKKDVISEDINAERLAIAWDADVVIGLGALLTLADNHKPFPSEWEIPVKVRVFKGLGFSKEHKIAFIDKTLPPRRIAPREQNLLYFKKVFKQLCGAHGKHKKVSQEKSDETHCPAEHEEPVSSNDEGSTSDEILQLDGTNDHELMESANGSRSRIFWSNCYIKDDKSTGNISKHALSENEFEQTNNSNFDKSSDGGHSFMQVDGGSDDMEDTNKTGSPKERDARRKSTESNFWTNPKRSSQKAAMKDSAPFSGRTIMKSWASFAAQSPEEFSSSDDPKKEEQPPQQSSKEHSSTGLSFGVLPDSALSMQENKRGNAGQLKKVQIEEETPTTVVANLRRSSRRKATTKKKNSAMSSKILRAFSKVGQGTQSEADSEVSLDSSKSMTKTKTFDKVLQDESNSSSDDERLINKATLKRQYQKKLSRNAENRKTRSVAVKTSSSEEISNEKTMKGNCTASTNDILGQILGVEPHATQTRKEVTSAWASEAETMRNNEPDGCYSADDLGLLQPAENLNVTYSLWKFGKRRVLVRYSLHGSLPATNASRAKKQSSSSTNKQNQTEVTLRTKLEYQADYAFESLTVSEICRDWLTMLVKRPSKIVRARIDPHRREILDVEWITALHHLQETAEKAGYSTAMTAKLLTKVFDMIAELGKGEYICSHAENETKMTVRKSVEEVGKKVVYDLHQGFANPGATVEYKQSVPWVPGDPQKPLKLHAENRTIPLMFEPKDSSPNSKSASGKGNRKKKK